MKAEYENDLEFNIDRLSTKCNLGGGGLRLINRRYSFINCMNNVIPQMSKLWPSIAAITENQEEREEEDEANGRWTTFFKESPHIGGQLEQAWEDVRQRHDELQQKIENAAITMPNDREWITKERSNNFGNQQKNKLSNKICEEFDVMEHKLLIHRAKQMDPQDPRKI